jgi:hypothetical protein
MPDDQMPICLIPMKDILCTNVNCGLKIKHSISAIERIFEFLPESSTAFQQIPYVCPMCKHLEIADVPSNPVKADPDEQPLTSGKCEYLVAIECDGEDCLHQIRAFATMERNVEIFEVEEQMREWSDGGATCVLDHHPRYPFVLKAVMDLASI